MTPEWKTTTLGDACDIYQPKTISTKEMTDDGPYPVYGANGVIGRYHSYNHEEPQLLVTCRGATCGSVNVSQPNSWITGNAMVVRPRGSSLDLRYLEYLFRGGIDVSIAITGAAQPQITRTNLSPIIFRYPSRISEQQRIVRILDEAFEGIATAKANAEKNLENARGIFDTQLRATLSEFGKKWNMVKLDEVTRLARGHNPPKSKFSQVQKPGYVRFYQIRDGRTDEYAVYVPDSPQLHKMEKDDIMMVAYRHIGRAFRGVEGAFNVALCKISNVRRDVLDDDYLYYLIPSNYIKGELLKRSERSLIPSMSIEHLRELQIPLPPLVEQHRLVQTVSALSTETQRLESLYQQKLAALGSLEQSLLHHAFSAQL
jgi:type I restriction enzyme, S subunit